MAKPTNRGPKKPKNDGRKKRTNRRKSKALSSNVKLSIALVGVLIAVVAGIAATNGGDDSTSTGTRAEQLVRPDSQTLATGSADDVLVEFLDFECESCRAAYPTVEELSNQYRDKMSVVVRYMPLHASSVNAAKAAEAAAAQGKFKDMYSKLFETQPEWGEQRTPERDKFFGYAASLGLDMAAFERVYNDPATEAKILRDEADGRALGVQGTPTFFMNGEKLNISGLSSLKPQVEQALAK